jgi:hypothetical protein
MSKYGDLWTGGLTGQFSSAAKVLKLMRIRDTQITGTELNESL